MILIVRTQTLRSDQTASCISFLFFFTLTCFMLFCFGVNRLFSCFFIATDVVSMIDRYYLCCLSRQSGQKSPVIKSRNIKFSRLIVQVAVQLHCCKGHHESHTQQKYFYLVNTFCHWVLLKAFSCSCSTNLKFLFSCFSYKTVHVFFFIFFVLMFFYKLRKLFVVF